MLRKENPKAVSKKRIGTPIKVKPNYASEQQNDAYLEDINKEIRELRERRLQHNSFNAKIQSDDEDDDFETAIFAETLLGELGSSSNSIRNTQEELEGTNEELTFLSADSGASDTEGKQPKIKRIEAAAPEETKGEAVMPEETKRSPSITDCLAGNQEVQEPDLSPFPLSQSTLPPLLESEIQKLLGNIKVRTSSIKETLKKQKDVIK